MSPVVTLHQSPGVHSTEGRGDPKRATCTHPEASARQQAAEGNRLIVDVTACRPSPDAGQDRSRAATGCRSRSHVGTEADHLFPPLTRPSTCGSGSPDVNHDLNLPLPPASFQSRDASMGRHQLGGMSVTPGRCSNREHAASSLDSCSSCCDSETEQTTHDDNTFEAAEGHLHPNTYCRSGCRLRHHCCPHHRIATSLDSVSCDGGPGRSGLEARDSQRHSALAESDESQTEVVATHPQEGQLNRLSGDLVASSVSHVTKLNVPVSRARSRSSSPRRQCKRGDQRHCRRGDRGRSSEKRGDASSVLEAGEVMSASREERTQHSAPSRRGETARGNAGDRLHYAWGDCSSIDNAAMTSPSLTARPPDVEDGSSSQAHEVQLREIKTDNETQCKRLVSAKGDNLGLPVRCASDDVIAHGAHTVASDVRVQGPPAVMVSRIQRTESGRSDPRVSSPRRGGQDLPAGRGHKPRFRQLNVTIHPGSDSLETADSSSLGRSQVSELCSHGSRHSTRAKIPLSSAC